MAKNSGSDSFRGIDRSVSKVQLQMTPPPMNADDLRQAMLTGAEEIRRSGTGRPYSSAELLDLVIARSRDLRMAGITSLSLDGIAVTFGPVPAPPSNDDSPPVDDSPPAPVDPLNDPSTYPGGKVPGFKRPVREE